MTTHFLVELGHRIGQPCPCFRVRSLVGLNRGNIVSSCTSLTSWAQPSEEHFLVEPGQDRFPRLLAIIYCSFSTRVIFRTVRGGTNRFRFVRFMCSLT
jgi:hypothetical protein